MIQKLFKPYIVRRKNGQCQILIPLVELDELCEKIVAYLKKGGMKMGLDNEEIKDRFSNTVTYLPIKMLTKLCYCLLLKRNYDGLNGRTWDACEHLEYENKIRVILEEERGMG